MTLFYRERPEKFLTYRCNARMDIYIYIHKEEPDGVDSWITNIPFSRPERACKRKI